MTHINPIIPAVGDTNWGQPLNAALTDIVTQVNTIDDEIATLAAGGVGSGGGGGAISVLDNGDGTLTLGGNSVVDNGDGTFTVLDSFVGGGGGGEPLGLSDDTRATLATTYLSKAGYLPLNVADYGAVGDGVADDTVALNAAYAAARTKAAAVDLGGRTYKLSATVNAVGVSTIGNGAHLVWAVTSTAGVAFTWGGEGCFVNGVIFDLSNTTASTAIQGVYNNVSNVRGQAFTNNMILCRTTNATSDFSNVYGAWFAGYGLSGLRIIGNYINGASYGIQVNAQTSNSQDVTHAALGNPSDSIVITGNVLVDAAIGVNTPGIFCTGVIISGNRILAKRFGIDMPINIAHVTGFTITGNVVTAGLSNSNGTVHVEDVAGAFEITGNTVTQTAANSGIQVSVVMGVSGDPATPTSGIISGNTVTATGVGGAGTYGILWNDTAAPDAIVSNNRVTGFAVGASTAARMTLQGNTIIRCTLGVDNQAGGISSGNTFIGCTNAYRTTFPTLVTGDALRGASGITPVKANGGVAHYKGLIYDAGTLTITSGVAQTILPLPTASFDGYVTTYLATFGFARHRIVWDGTTFTATQVGHGYFANLGSIDLSKSGSNLQVSCFVAGGNPISPQVTVIVDDLMY